MSNQTTFSIGNNTNLLHVKFHSNRFQDNLLSKKLKQLNLEEMKARLKYQRTSNDLLLFLNDCQKSTGYYAKLKPSSLNSASSARFSFKSSNSNNNNTNESFDCQSTEFIQSSDFKQEFLIKSENYFRPKIDSANVHHQRSINNFDENDDNLPVSSSSSAIMETNSNSNSSNNGNNKIPFFEHLLMNRFNVDSSPSLANTNKCSKSGAQLLFKTSSASSRSSNSSTCYSNSSESINEVTALTSTPVFNSNTNKLRPITSNVYATKSRNIKKTSFNHKTTMSNIDWFTSTLNFQDELSNNSKSKKINSNSTVSTSSNKNSINCFLNERPKTTANSCSKYNKKIRKNNTKIASCVPINDLQSKSLCFSLNSNANDIKDRCSVNEDSFISRSNILNMKFRCSSNNLFQQPTPQPNTTKMFQINMSRSLIKKKQLEIMNEYKNSNKQELINNLRQVQENLSLKVKQFTAK
jgi:hypothetical protein